MTNVVKSAAYTFIQAWIGTSLLALTGWLTDVLDWVSNLGDGGEAVVAFPDPTALLKLIATGIVSLVIAVVTALHTYFRDKNVPVLGAGSPPVYPDTPKEEVVV